MKTFVLRKTYTYYLSVEANSLEEALDLAADASIFDDDVIYAGDEEWQQDNVISDAG